MRRTWITISITALLATLAVVLLRRPPDPIVVFQKNMLWGIDFVTDELGFPYRTAVYETKGLKATECLRDLDRIYVGWKKESRPEGDIDHVKYQRRSRHA